MKSKKNTNPLDILKKIDLNFEEKLVIKKIKININEEYDKNIFDENVFISNINSYFYFIGSLLEDKIIIPKDNFFYFEDFKSPIKDLMVAFKIFYNTSLFNHFNELKDLKERFHYEYLNLNIDFKTFKLFFIIKNKIYHRYEDILKYILLVEDYEKEKNKEIVFNKRFLNSEENNEKKEIYLAILKLFEELKNITDFFNDYNFKVLKEYDYYRYPEQNFFPKDIFETYIAHLSEHLDKLSLSNKNLKNNLIKLISNKNKTEKSKVIISRLPENESIYENPQIIYNVISHLDAITVNDEIISKIESLYETHPHFSEVIDYILLSVSSNLRKDKLLKFKPILLLGTNGIGKSTFINDLNNIFNLINNSINYGSITTPAEISGLTAMWRTGSVGFITKVINTNNFYNPIVIFEEIDKAVNESHNGNVLSPLYDLFEKRTAEKFYDNYLTQTMDFSNVNYIATANKIKNIDYGIINRFTVFNISPPNNSQIPKVVNSIYNNLIKNDLFDNIIIDEKGINSIINSIIAHKINNIRAISKMIEKILMEASLLHKSNDIFIIDYICDEYLTKKETLH